MPVDGEYEPSTWEWVRDQVSTYESTGGKEGGTLQDVPIIVVTNKGAKSGKVRKTPVMRVEHDGSYAMIASKGGAPENPLWYYNVVAHPEVEVQDGEHNTDMTARAVTGDERAVWWERALAVWPHYDEYQAKTERVIPVFVLEPAS